MKSHAAFQVFNYGFPLMDTSTDLFGYSGRTAPLTHPREDCDRSLRFIARIKRSVIYSVKLHP